jgi:hypothetical protein
MVTVAPAPGDIVRSMSSGTGGGVPGCALAAFTDNTESIRQISHRAISVSGLFANGFGIGRMVRFDRRFDIEVYVNAPPNTAGVAVLNLSC